MRATPKLLDGSLDPRAVMPVAGDGGLFVQCVVYDPPSAAGQTVDVFFPADQITPLLLAFRDKARDNRQRSGPQADAVSPLLHPQQPEATLDDLIAQAEYLANRRGRE